ncbi:MAG: type II toxin-antitoxin system RelE/ParE family toxin [Methylococcales bacterium]|jgi:plasmid stabilization system protein ParE|uniref:type II toxin-antitoxin system RelE/ParE family toxin n=1 Tax=Methylicorpusculum sp. TaxID=2713644 RepID=UPI002AB8D9C7|nr:type II toxin-antitoxin system RelE/ParE family toxin [Methylicorpusculum sp.]MDZ4150391.1 type II toxin-antitoxin system RelE/ParE family toxin [Methylicorpusculum sp.]MDZ4157100.1 type II toxin-antitoxin system RelE/ParE family toxin [Methylococcales bacterium]
MTKAKTSYRIVWRLMAEADLDNIIDYIAQDNPTKAEKFGQALRDRVLPLAQHPKLGRTGRPGLPVFLRELVAHRNYIVFYRVLDEARTVEILRLKHTAQQLPGGISTRKK